MGIGAISPIGAYSSISYIQPLQYPLENRSKVSESYGESVKRIGSDAVKAVSPVKYADAQAYQGTGRKTAAQTRKTEMELAGIAAGFYGVTTGYGRNAVPCVYDMSGSLFNEFA